MCVHLCKQLGVKTAPPVHSRSHFEQDMATINGNTLIQFNMYKLIPSYHHVWCSLHCTMFGVPSIVPCLVFPPLYHVWCSLHCTMFGVPSIVPCLVFPPLYHVWCSLHCTMFGVPSIVRYIFRFSFSLS